MSVEPVRRRDGSRYLYEPFTAATARVDTIEAVLEARWAALEGRLMRIEEALERIERRMWMAVTGLCSVIVIEAVTFTMAQL
ncbi:MAG: hypothetical protein AAGJ96_06960 [Pseudomonadota bacterium]